MMKEDSCFTGIEKQPSEFIESEKPRSLSKTNEDENEEDDQSAREMLARRALKLEREAFSESPGKCLDDTN
jgi:hypothetical protein